MLLSDRTIRDLLTRGVIGLNIIDPERQIQPASVDLRLDNKFVILEPKINDWMPTVTVVDTRPGGNQPRMTERTVKDGDGWLLKPGDFVLAQTVERIRLPSNIAARVEGRSSFARLAIQVHSTAGWIDPGFDGHITLEISNTGPLHVKLFPGQYITQVSFYQMDHPAERPYHGKYQGQDVPTPSRLHIRG